MGMFLLNGKSARASLWPNIVHPSLQQVYAMKNVESENLRRKREQEEDIKRWKEAGRGRTQTSAR